MNNGYVIRAMQASDCRVVAGMHKAELADALLSQLGIRFLERLYACLLAEPMFKAFVVLDGEKICGFIAISMNAEGLFRRVYRHHAFALALEVLLAGMRRPSLIWRAAQVVFSRSPELDVKLPDVELLSIGVDASQRTRGLGKKLLNHAITAVKTSGEPAMFVVVNSKIPANGFYQSCGFSKLGSTNVHGACMNYYILHV